MSSKKIISLFFFLSVQVLFAQEYYFNQYHVEQGLSNNTILCSMQDSRGFMWFGTKEGLNRFDGYFFKTFQSDPELNNGLTTNMIRDLYEDKNKNIWIGTDQGIFIFNPFTESFSIFSDQILGEILEIQGDAQGNIWFISNLTAYYYSLENKKITELEVNNKHVTALSNVINQQVFFTTTNKEILQFSKSTLIRRDTLVENINRHLSIEKVYANGKDELFLGTTNSGVLLHNLQSKKTEILFSHDKNHFPIFVRDINQQSPDEYWFATESGLYIYNRSTSQVKNIQKEEDNPFGISDNALYTICKDNNNGIWIGSYFGGVNYYSPKNGYFEKIFHRNTTNSIKGSAVREITQDKNGDIWIGTEDAGLTKWNTKKNQFSNYYPSDNNSKLSHTNIHGLLAVGDTLLVGTFQSGLDFLSIGSDKVIKHFDSEAPNTTLHSDFIYHIYRTRKNKILIATGRGLYEYFPKTSKFALLSVVPDYIFYTSIFEDSNENIWLGTWRDGLISYSQKDNSSKVYRHEANLSGSISSNRVNRVFEDSKKNIWVATDGGLCQLLANGQFKRFGKKDGFPNNFALAMLEDDQKNLWITTSKGLVRMSIDTYQTRTFGTENGLLTTQFNYNSAFKDAEGYLYFGSSKGLIRFLPKNLNSAQSSIKTPLYITGFQIYNESSTSHESSPQLDSSIIFTDKISLNHNQSSFSIDFAALNFYASQSIEYAYKLEGFDKDWTQVKTNRKAYFTKVPPGKYTFLVKIAGNEFGENVERRIEIEIHPPFWKSKFAYFVYCLLVVLAISYIYKSYVRKIKARNRQKIILINEKKEKELHRAKIDFFTNITHEIKTPLTLIKAPLERVIQRVGEDPSVSKLLNTMDNNTNKLVELTNQLLDITKLEVHGFGLHFEQKNINQILSNIIRNFELLAEEKGIRLTFKQEQQIVAEIDEDSLDKICTNLISNAVKYAQKEVTIVIKLNEEKSHFIILVKNDGLIIPYSERNNLFAPFFRLKQNIHIQGTGLGLSLAKSLTELHNGKLELLESQNHLNIFYLTIPLKKLK
ncbi:ligand-binding sensor domain-containing protein [Sphingobacterium hungaricum]|uniref:histidine kinase n=1 Tax=Sphingobacterium hungaricum TaxID=2082723 RepID=A0A928UY20_9SPHI|nr:sensor histidine kinase [Sphingobacterium hungaricum]MBE8714093.1 histidine kinase [Sphingobacterium hungaricum]